MARYLLWCLPAVICSVVTAADITFTNPTRREYKDELIHFDMAGAGPWVVKEDGTAVASQAEGGRLWVCTNFAPGASHKYSIEPGTGAASAPKVTIRKEGICWLLDNGQIAVRVPAVAGSAVPGPIAGIQVAGKWIGGSAFQTASKLKAFSATQIGDGTVLAKVRLRYEFDAMAGVDGNVPAFAQVDVSLAPGTQHVEVFETHEMMRGDFWEIELSKGWGPKEGISKPFSGGFAPGRPQPNRALLPGGIPFGREDLFINLFPRWNQHCKDGWAFAASDGTNVAGAVVVKASQWIWPHNNALQAIVKPSGDYAGLRGSTWKGQRLWWLVNSTAPMSADYVARYAWENLDKLNHEFVLDWPGQKGGFNGMNFYYGGQMNPTGGIRGAGRRAMANAAKSGDISTLTRAQVMLHEDAYGSYWNFWSPENPNFYSDFMRVPIGLTCSLREHPQFEKLRQRAVQRLREDLYNSVTLPGGAGQECPGYLGHALGIWTGMAQPVKQYLNFDIQADERFIAGRRFLRRISHPDGEIRRMLPMGDTHPGAGGGQPVEVAADEVRAFKTEELPGFGVIFNNNPGTAKETYLAFKAGPNRGHYHGDQLALHYCADAKPVAVDHHCSYHPRAGQEHMHNRVAFHTEQMPYANMDGYERLIGFKTSADADIAVGQVESDRLRQTIQHPPENWHHEYPQIALGGNMVYRRTVVVVKNGPKDYVVLRDQFTSPIALKASFCLHVRSEKIEQKANAVDFGNLTLVCASPAKTSFQSFPWSHSNGGPESTQGARLTIDGQRGEFVTVLYPGPNPPVKAIANGVQVGGDQVTFGDDVVVSRGGKEIVRLASAEINLDRSQGQVGIFVPDAGYPFGEIPDWLIKQRGKRPDWAK